MRLTARQIRSINSTLANINERSIYNNDKQLPSSEPNRTYTRITVVNPSRSS